MEYKEIMTFMDEEGNKVQFEPIAEIFLEEIKYLILAPTEGKNKDEDAFVFRVDIENEKEVLNLVDDDAEFEKVKKEYKNLLYNKE